MLREKDKENEFLKKAAAFFAKEISQLHDTLMIIKNILVGGG